MGNQLEELSVKMDEIDKQLVDLLNNRMKLSHDIAEERCKAGLSPADPAHERALLAKVGTMTDEAHAAYIQSIFNTVTAVDRSCRNHGVNASSELYESIRAALKNTPELFPQRATVACQGSEGSHSQLACDKVFKSPTILYFNTFENVFKAVEKGMCEYGILPIEYSTAGSVNAIYDLMTKHNFSIVRSVRLRVGYDLLARPNTKKNALCEIYSTEDVLASCGDYLGALKNVKVTPVEDLDTAARKAMQSENTAAVSTRFSAEAYGLKVLEAEIQDIGDNYTRFICISKNHEIYPGADRVSLMMTLPHKPGALYYVLSKFYALGINLLKLESRPLADRGFEFMFYFDLECSVYSPEMERLFCDLEAESEQFRYLGAYSELTC